MTYNMNFYKIGHFDREAKDFGMPHWDQADKDAVRQTAESMGWLLMYVHQNEITEDNIEEIILTRTGDNSTDANNFYRRWSIQILKKSANTYTDQTNKFIDDFYDSTGSWISWGHFRDKDNDGKVEFFNTGYPGSSNYLEWELTESGLERQ